ncbi:MAG: BrnT family toxin [Thermodesulfobacteriota bacterium]
MELTFEWDEKKASSNLRKHEVSFKEVKTIFNDPLSITIPDPRHSGEEDRYVDIGLSAKGRVLVVVYTERQKNIRIISSRKATKTEHRNYEQKQYKKRKIKR